MRTLLIALLLVCAGSFSAESDDVIRIGRGDFIFDADPELNFFGKMIVLDPIPAGADNEGAELIAGLFGMRPGMRFPFEVRTSSGLENGFAVIHNTKRYIVYDREWYDLYSSSIYGGAVLVLAHELGHHVCGHRGALDTAEGNWRQELEADRYSGAAVHNFERETLEMKARPAYTINDLIEAAERTYAVEGSETHPPRAMRIAAIGEGYNHGSPCESRGFVTPRELTPSEKAEIAREEDEALENFCMEQVRAWCKTRDGNTRVLLHRLMSTNCDIPKAITANPGVAYPGITCQGGGVFISGRFKNP